MLVPRIDEVQARPVTHFCEKDSGLAPDARLGSKNSKWRLPAGAV